jgi:hypothetical protein
MGKSYKENNKEGFKTDKRNANKFIRRTTKNFLINESDEDDEIYDVLTGNSNSVKWIIKKEIEEE